MSHTGTNIWSMFKTQNYKLNLPYLTGTPIIRLWCPIMDGRNKEK